MKVVTKFICESVFTNGDHVQVFMRPDYPKDDNPDHPNREFWKATPAGSLQMTITNQAAAEAFEQGAVYTMTFEKD